MAKQSVKKTTEKDATTTAIAALRNDMADAVKKYAAAMGADGKLTADSVKLISLHASHLAALAEDAANFNGKVDTAFLSIMLFRYSRMLVIFNAQTSDKNKNDEGDEQKK